jgi:Sodium/calcium exchanger protein
VTEVVASGAVPHDRREGLAVNSVLALLLGLGALVLGAEMVVREGAALAARFNVSPLVVGMTIVSLGTSLPELAIGLNAAQQGNAGLAVGNIVGTNLVNILLILGLSALIRPVAFEARTLRWDLPTMTGAALLLFDAACRVLSGFRGHRPRRTGPATTWSSEGSWLLPRQARVTYALRLVSRSWLLRALPERSLAAGAGRSAVRPGSATALVEMVAAAADPERVEEHTGGACPDQTTPGCREPTESGRQSRDPFVMLPG